MQVELQQTMEDIDSLETELAKLEAEYEAARTATTSHGRGAEGKHLEVEEALRLSMRSLGLPPDAASLIKDAGNLGYERLAATGACHSEAASGADTADEPMPARITTAPLSAKERLLECFRQNSRPPCTAREKEVSLEAPFTLVGPRGRPFKPGDGRSRSRER